MPFPGSREEHEQRRVRHLWRRSVKGGQFQDHGKPNCPRTIFRWRSPRHRRHYRGIQLPSRLDYRLDRRNEYGNRVARASSLCPTSEYWREKPILPMIRSKVYLLRLPSQKNFTVGSVHAERDRDPKTLNRGPA